MTNFFGGKDPFDHPFFTQPFGGLFNGKSPFDDSFFSNHPGFRKQITIEELKIVVMMFGRTISQANNFLLRTQMNIQQGCIVLASKESHMVVLMGCTTLPLWGDEPVVMGLF